jgi:hypothetical protein
MSSDPHVMYPLFFSEFNATWISPTVFSQKIQKISNYMKIYPVGAELFHADRGTHGLKDRNDEANSRVSQFCERA